MNITKKNPDFIRALLASIFVPAANAILHWQIFVFLRDAELPTVVTMLLAVAWGIFGIYTIYLSFNWMVEQYSDRWQKKLQPFVFVGPAAILLAWLLFIPTVRTVYLSFFNADSSSFVGFQNYLAVFTERTLLIALRNNLLWVAVGTTLCVFLGLLIAILADRSSFERLAKAIIFMPMAISFVAAGVIWRFMYHYKPGDDQVGLLNALVITLGGEPQTWLGLQPWNNLFLIAILVWMQTGFAVVILSAAIKGIPEELLEAARVDGANEIKIFFKIMMPYISGTIVAVTTTILVFTLKIFDVVMVMTGGQFGTDVVATQFYRQFFMFRNFGYGSTLAIVLLVMIIPVIVFNLRKFMKEESF